MEKKTEGQFGNMFADQLFNYRMPYRREVPMNGKIADFVINDRIIVELKLKSISAARMQLSYYMVTNKKIWLVICNKTNFNKNNDLYKEIMAHKRITLFNGIDSALEAISKLKKRHYKIKTGTGNKG